MNQELGLRVLSQIMGWTEEDARSEFAWVRLMARLKYDGYRDFQAGVRFIESLANWLQQFEPAERPTAYDLVRRSLVYIGPGEMHRLVEQFMPRTVRPRLWNTVAGRLGLPRYRVLADPGGRHAIDVLRRKTLFMGLSDGARIDVLRHVNAGLLSNEQLVIATQVDREKWHDLLASLRDDLKDAAARFALVYLIDDFVGSGTSLLRYNDTKKKWSGKLMKFKASAELAHDTEGDLFEPDWQLCIHHYVASARGAADATAQEQRARPALTDTILARGAQLTFGMTLPESLPIAGNHPFVPFTQKYYDPVLKTPHTDVGGVDHLGLGYAGCALPLVLDHNTPNNSVALIWADTEGGTSDGGRPAPAMRPLFRRRQRHS